jgi:hypothetical protein
VGIVVKQSVVMRYLSPVLFGHMLTLAEWKAVLIAPRH